MGLTSARRQDTWHDNANIYVSSRDNAVLDRREITVTTSPRIASIGCLKPRTKQVKGRYRSQDPSWASCGCGAAHAQLVTSKRHYHPSTSRRSSGPSPARDSECTVSSY
jgi:hypothetical protein